MYQHPPPGASEPLEPALKLWRHIFGRERGLLHVFTGTRSGDKLTDARDAHFNFPQAAESAAKWAMQKAEEGREVYFCAHLLAQPKRRKENAASVRALWGELDGAALPNSNITPTAVVESSPKRYHVYWRLDASISPQEAEALNKRLARAIGGDPSGCDLSQLLRVPGTINHKYPEHPRVGVVELNASREYSRAELDEHLPSLTSEAVTPSAAPLAAGGEERGGPPVRLGPAHLKIWRGEAPKRTGSGDIDRSATLYEIARMLAWKGATAPTIAAALRERDETLGFRKYVGRADADERYRTTSHAACRDAENWQSAEPEPEGAESFTTFTAFTANARERSANEAALAVEPFPVHALPEGCRQLVREASETIGCPPDFVAVPMLAALGGAVGLSYMIQVVEGWTEAANLWVATVGHPGARKTPPAREAKRPVAALQAKLHNEYRKKLAEHDREEDCGERPVKKTVYVDDITTEALITVLAESPSGVIQFKDELLGLIRGLDQYKGGRGSDRQFYLSGWSGESFSYRRKGNQEDVFLVKPFISVVGSIQTDLLHEISSGREDGLADRFLYCYPDRVRARLTAENRISEHARESYAALYSRLRGLEHGDTDGYDNPKPRIVEPTQNALALLLDLINGLREETELPGFPVRLMRVWSKLEAYLARLALIMSLCRNATLRELGEAEALRIEDDDVVRAMVILDYFKSHIRRVHAHLHGEDRAARLTEDVARFLVECGGEWSGTASAFHEALESACKPERPNELAKFLKKRAETRREFLCERTTVAARKPDGGQTTERVMVLKLLR